jgi:hypothetical protein
MGGVAVHAEIFLFTRQLIRKFARWKNLIFCAVLSFGF